MQLASWSAREDAAAGLTCLAMERRLRQGAVEGETEGAGGLGPVARQRDCTQGVEVSTIRSVGGDVSVLDPALAWDVRVRCIYLFIILDPDLTNSLADYSAHHLLTIGRTLHPTCSIGGRCPLACT